MYALGKQRHKPGKPRRKPGNLFAAAFIKVMLLSIVLLAAGAYTSAMSAPVAPPGMRLIPAGEFEMGSREEYAWPEERPAHRVRLSQPFYLDQTEVTNTQFERFVRATGYKTLAERPVRLEDIMKQVPPGTAPPPKEALLPGSLVFVVPSAVTSLRDASQWWRWTIGASWRTPEGPGSHIDGKGEYPSVHLAWEDAQAYCKWAGKRLPTEAEWERAARGGVDGLPYVWGSEKPNEAASPSRWFANVWQGRFPTRNDRLDGFAGIAPVKSYQPNPYGLYDMAGNVWEWTADWYEPNAYARRVSQVVVDPAGPATASDASQRRSQRGGSFLCHDSYCSRYRPGARSGAAADSGTSHAGVRCAKSALPAR